MENNRIIIDKVLYSSNELYVIKISYASNHQVILNERLTYDTYDGEILKVVSIDGDVCILSYDGEKSVTHYIAPGTSLFSVEEGRVTFS